MLHEEFDNLSPKSFLVEREHWNIERTKTNTWSSILDAVCGLSSCFPTLQ